jgi:SNF2 family DNA or RNA helicase
MVANPKSRQSKAVKMIAPFFKYIYLASGTPADEEQKYYAQLNILDPALVKHQPYQGWCQEYFFPSKYSEYDPGEIKPEKKEELQDIVQRVCVRRFATDVLALPENFIQDYYVQFTPEHKDIYQGLVTEMLQRIKNEKGSLSSRTVINRFQGLILAIDNPALILRHGDKYSHELTVKAGQFNFEKEHSKVEALLDIVEKHKNSKIVVWSSHPSVGDHLYSLLKKYNPLIIHGESLIPKELKTRDQYKVYVKELFEKSDHQILIAGEQVLNTSITMVVPNVQVYFDVDFNYTNKNQSERRIYRIGQEQAVYTYNIIIGGSLDVVRAKNLKDKDFVNRKFLSHEYLTLDLAREMFTMEPDDE